MAVTVLPNEDEREISDVVTRFFRERTPLSGQLAAAQGEVTLPRALYRELASLDILSLALPGGAEALGLTPLISGLIAEAGGRELVPGPWLDQLIAVRALGADEKLAAPLVSAEQIAAVAFHADLSTESGSASGMVRGLRFGDRVDRWVVLTENAIIVVNPAGPGVAEVEWEASIDPLWQSVTATLDSAPVLAHVQLDADERDALLGYARGVTAAWSVGAGLRLLEDGVAYVNERNQFGRPVGSFQAVKHRATNAYVALLHAQCLARRALATESSHDARVARVASDRAYRFVSEQVLQLYGAIGFTAELPVHLFLKNAQQLRAWPTHVDGDLRYVREHLRLDLVGAVA